MPGRVMAFRAKVKEMHRAAERPTAGPERGKMDLEQKRSDTEGENI
jgi:hypothetical protein